MPVDTRQLLNCSYGTAGFVLEKWKLKSTPVVQYGIHTSDSYEAEGEGSFDADTPAAYQAKLDLIRAALSLSGQNFQLTGLAGQEHFSLLAAQMQNGGPHVDYTITTGEGALHGKITFTVKAQTIGVNIGSNNDPTNSYTDTLKVKPDTYHVASRDGQISGSNSKSYFLGTVLPAYRAAYPLPNWVITYQYKQPLDGSKVDYTIEATQLIAPLPAGGGTRSLDGTIRISTERDEQQRKVTNWSFQLVSDADPTPLLNVIRPANVTILRESVQMERLREFSLQANFQTLESGSNDALLNFEQTFEWSDPPDVWEPRSFPGIDPVVVRKPREFATIVQSGSAAGIERYPTEPDPLFPDQLIDRPKINYARRGMVECVTTWSYTMYAVLTMHNDDIFFVFNNKSKRPQNPSFKNG